MTNPETTSRQALDEYRRTFRHLGPLTSGVVPYPGLEASHLSSFGRSQPIAEQASGGSADVSRESPPSSPTTPRPAITSPAQATTASIRQAYPNVYSEPQSWQHWHYYDPTRHGRRSFSHLQATPLLLSSPMSGPRSPSIPSGTALVKSPTDPMLELLLASLKALQSQFTAFQDSLGNVNSDVKDALSQLHALRTAQNKTDKCVAELEGVIGVTSTGTKARGRGRWTRGRGTRGGKAGTHTELLLDVGGADTGTVPEKTLIQSVASIQSAIEELLARENCPSQSHLSVNHREGATSIQPCLPSVNLTGQESSHISSPFQSVIDPSQQLSTLQSTKSVSATSSTSQSDSSSPLSSIAIPTPESNASPSHAAPGKEYADASIQACSPSCPPSYSHRHALGLTPVDWSVDSAMLVQPVSNLLRPTALTAEHLAHFLRDAHLPSATNSVTDSQTSQRDNDYPLRGSTASYTHLPTHMISAPSLSPDSRTPQARWTMLPAASSSPDTLVVPSASGTGPAMQTLSSPARISQSPPPQTSPLTTEAINSSPGMGPSGDSQMSPTSPLSSLTSIGNTPASVSGAFMSQERPGQPHAELDPEDAQMTCDIESDAISVTGAVNIHAHEPIPIAPGYRRQSTPVDADDEGLPSGLPTPPSETFTDEHELQVVSHLTREHGAATDQKLISRTHLRNFPVIPTPPSLTPEPSVQEDRAVLPFIRRGSTRQDLLGLFSESLSPLSPLLPSPSLAVGSSLSEEGVGDVSGQLVAHKVTEKHTDSLDDAGVVSGGDATEGVSVDVKASTSTMGPEVPVITVTNKPPRSIAVPNDDSSPIPQVAEDADLFMTPESPAGQPNIELPECYPDADGISPAYTQMDGYDFRFSSPSPPTSTTPSRYATPSDSSNSRPTQEEDEVWGALMLGASGMSTPVPDYPSLPLMFSHQPSRASSVSPHLSQQPSTSTSTSVELFAVDPSMLHDPPLLPHRSELQSLSRDSNRSLSLLTSFDDTDEDVVERPSKKLRASAVSVVRAASNGTIVDERAGSRSLGGPSASLSQLALLARREPLKIHLRLPETMRNLKRKRDAVNVEGNEVEGEKDGADSERVCPGASMPVDDASQDGQEGVVPTGVSANVPISRIGAVTSAPSKPTPTMPQLAPESSTSSDPAVDAGECPDAPSHLSVPHKRTNKRSERGGEEAHASIRQKNKSKRAPKAKPKSLVKYHVWNGKIVSVELEPTPTPTPTPELQPQTSATSSASQPSIHVEEASQDSRSPTRLRHRKGQENQAMETPLSSLARHPTSRNPRCVRSSPTKEDVWNNICQGGREWPELPIAFSHWDIQFIQCDNCDKWYHYGCVAIESGDPRLEPGTLFICPTCHTQSARRQTLRHHDDMCARPDCPEPQITGDTETYYVEKLVGRKKMEGYIYTWLAKWEGYPMSQATWIPKENVVGDGTRLFNAFLEDALEEGADLSRNVVLLQEALAAGWDG